MSTTTYRDSPTSTPLSRRPKRTSSISSNASNNDRTRVAVPSVDELSSPLRRNSFQIRSQHLLTPAPPLPDLRPRTRSTTTDSSSKAKQTYTFSNVPRELDRSARSPKANQLRHRISSAPNEKPTATSPRSQVKSSSATQSTPPARRPPFHQPTSEQERNSFHDLIKHSERSRVPAAVQKRRLILMLHRPSLTNDQNPADLHPHPPPPPLPKETFVPPLILEDERFDAPTIDALRETQPEMADSLDLFGILREINKDETASRTSPSPRELKLDPNKYNFVAANSLDNTRFLLSPRTLTPSEERAVQSRHSQYYRQEMGCSVHAKLPTLIASIVLDNSNNTLERTASLHDKMITVRFNSNGTATMRNDNTSESPVPLEATMENEKVDLFYDATLNGFYDPNTGLYYELKST